MSWSSQWAVIVLTLLLEAVWNLVVSTATEDKLFLHTMCFRHLQSCSVWQYHFMSELLMLLVISTSQKQHRGKKNTNYSKTNYVTMGPLEVLNILLIVIKWLWFRNVTPE